MSMLRREDPDSESTATGAGESVFTQQVRYITAANAFAAAVLHLLAMISHSHHPTLARAFLAVAVLQIIWGVMLIVQPGRLLYVLGAIGMGLSIAVWAFSCTKGVSWFPGLESVEPLEWRDVVTQFFQLLALAGACLLLVPATAFQPAPQQRDLRPIAAGVIVLAMATLALVYIATRTYVHQ